MRDILSTCADIALCLMVLPVLYGWAETVLFYFRQGVQWKSTANPDCTLCLGRGWIFGHENGDPVGCPGCQNFRSGGNG